MLTSLITKYIRLHVTIQFYKFKYADNCIWKLFKQI